MIEAIQAELNFFFYSDFSLAIRTRTELVEQVPSTEVFL